VIQASTEQNIPTHKVPNLGIRTSLFKPFYLLLPYKDQTIFTAKTKHLTEVCFDAWKKILDISTNSFLCMIFFHFFPSLHGIFFCVLGNFLVARKNCFVSI